MRATTVREWFPTANDASHDRKGVVPHAVKALARPRQPYFTLTTSTGPSNPEGSSGASAL